MVGAGKAGGGGHFADPPERIAQEVLGLRQAKFVQVMVEADAHGGNEETGKVGRVHAKVCRDG